MSPPAQPEQISVLLIDHTPRILHMLERMVGGFPELHVLAALGTVHEALERARELHPQVVVYGFSVRLPQTVAALPRVRSTFRDSYVVASSFDPDDAGERAARDAGLDTYVSGFELDIRLVPALLEWARGKKS